MKGRTVDSPRLAAGLFADLVSPAQAVEAEHFVVVAMDGRGVVIDAAVLTIGDVSCCIVSPPQVLRWALTRERPARSFMVMHNHPSGDPTPSQEDVNVTRALHEAGRAVGLPFVDHVVVAFANGIVYRSLSADGYVPLLHEVQRGMVAK